MVFTWVTDDDEFEHEVVVVSHEVWLFNKGNRYYVTCYVILYLSFLKSDALISDLSYTVFKGKVPIEVV